MKATARISAGTLTSNSHDSEKPSRIAMTIPPTAMIGAITSIVNVISTRICTCCTSLVLRVISDAAPKRPISRAENVPTWWKIPARRSRPTPIATPALNQVAAIEAMICTTVSSNICPPAPTM